jgi:hypothetical protein
MDLANFLLARADDVDAEAGRMGEASWGLASTADAARLNLFSQQMRVQADVLRRVVKLHTEAEPSAHECMGDSSTYGIAEYDDPCPTLRLLGLLFAGHPEFDRSWLP